MAAPMKKLFIVIKFVEKMGLSDLKLKAGSQFLTSLNFSNSFDNGSTLMDAQLTSFLK